MPQSLLLLLFTVAWVGHATVWTALLSNLYGRPLPKPILRSWRLLTGVIILLFPLLAWSVGTTPTDTGIDFDGPWSAWVARYCIVCLLFGGIVFPAVTLYRLLRKKPAAVLSEKSEVIDFGAKVGPAAVGDGKFSFLAKLPLNNVLKVEITELTLRLKWLPAPLEGLTVLVISDLHFHGTPSRAWYDALFDHLAVMPKPDVLALVGDYVDTDTHHEWIRPLLGKLGWNEVGLAVLGNHDIHHHPDTLRAELKALGLVVLGNGWKVVPVRGVPVVFIGHEGPWFTPPTTLMGAPLAGFRLCLSHTPDNFYWACEQSVDLVLAGHVHGGGIRVPVVGSIFVPSVFGRRFDQGVFEKGRTVMAVGRGVSGKEVTRVGCLPQVLRLTLTASA
jgi:hypothetical protein